MPTNPTPRRATHNPTHREWPYRLGVVTLIVAGIIITLLPVAGTYYNNWHQNRFANQQTTQQNQLTDAQETHWLTMAHTYNEKLPAESVTDPWTGPTAAETDPAYRAYLAQLAGTQVMARIRIPSIHVVLPVYHGTSDRVLGIGAGHMFGTSLPVGGAGTHAAIAAHRGESTMTGFDNLPSMKRGDEFFIDVYGATLAYKVTEIATVLPDDVKTLRRRPGADQVTLITCTPYGINTHRLLVTGDRIPLAAAGRDATAWTPKFSWTVQGWMHTRLWIVGVALLMLLVLLSKWARDDHHARLSRRARRALDPNTAPEGYGGPR